MIQPLLLAAALAAPAQAEPWGPWDRPAPPASAKSEAQAPSSLPFMGLIRGYQLLLSPQDAASCPMFPSCSRFSMEAFARFGPIQGLLMTSDRFLRENGEAHVHYPPVRMNGRVLYQDLPTERNLW